MRLLGMIKWRKVWYLVMRRSVGATGLIIVIIHRYIEMSYTYGTTMFKQVQAYTLLILLSCCHVIGKARAT